MKKRNVAIIAHVDHGKTTLVDEILKTSGMFRDNEDMSNVSMDSNQLEKERGITILAKTTALDYNDYRINILDTPGHADFGGEVERIMNMVDGAILVVDAYEGPMPQTRFVLKKAFEAKVKPIVVINKVDKPSARCGKVLDEILDLFIELGADEEQLDFKVVYASALNGTCSLSDDLSTQTPGFHELLDLIISEIPAPTGSKEENLQMQPALLDYNEFVGRISALLNPFTYVLINIATVILIAKAGLQVNLGTMHQGQVVALYNYMAQMIVELIKLASLIITLNKAMACADRVAGVLDIRTTMHYPETPSAKADPSANEVEFDKVSFTYAGAGASSLSDISFSVKKGQTVGIIGGTGCGKSTLVSLISRFYDVTCGTVKLNGRNVKELTNQEIHDKVGIVQQRSVLFKGSIRDNMKWGNENASDSEIWDALKVAQAKEVVEGKDGQLDFMLEQNGKNLSGGQRQRLTIARALVKKPEILILDDSLSALDFATDAALRKALAELEGETTTFLVSQRVAGIRQADKILVLDNGELAGSGTHDELMKSCEVYREIYFSQFPEDRAKYERGEM